MPFAIAVRIVNPELSISSKKESSCLCCVATCFFYSERKIDVLKYQKSDQLIKNLQPYMSSSIFNGRNPSHCKEIKMVIKYT